MRDELAPPVRPELAGCHTAGPIAALAAAAEVGLYEPARNILFLTAGAGLAIATALYAK